MSETVKYSDSTKQVADFLENHGTLTMILGLILRIAGPRFDKFLKTKNL
jgi:hypothetical protein